MIGGLWNGLSGLNIFDKALSVESNNITNVSTVGHKADDIRFEDLMYQNGYGNGSAVQSIDKRTIQGGLQVTGNSYDVAIDGKGYFIVEERETGDTAYTRAGNFQMSEDGLLQTANSLKVLGMTPQTTSIVTSNENETTFTNEYNTFIASQTISNENSQSVPADNFIKTINTKATNYLVSAQDSGISGSGYKSADSKISDIDALMSDYNSKLETYSLSADSESTVSISQITTIDYSNLTTNLVDENDSINVFVNNSKISQQFDTDIQTTLNKFSDKLSNVKGLTSTVDTTTGIVEIMSLIPGKEVTISEASINNNYSLITNTQVASLGSGQGLVDSSRTALKNALETADAKLIDITSEISLNEDTLVLNEIQMKLDNLDLVEESFGSVIIDDGNIYLKDGNNSFLVGKIETATFKNEQGLDPLGDNLYRNTAESGIALKADDMNTLISSSLELSNANISTSLTSLLVYQKAYEANSKSITTSDEMLTTAMDLIK
ncbi:flagellar hook-basal body complex protein [Poseidonibacter lekithochrous]|uniref:flagellar hook-basal body complex protein n=1 Tax=Poseidonibacter TaxID=2321187 RepID=UPI001C08BB55|nr:MULTISPECIES: flagellar hook-basal body complex protein [Poseidonibacter]MBU3015505.1 flagellar hook-basal body complex protein [Poseidonibacter lekithochrous]MDO6828804.1 flagellar hook-basal body complex protein [Poseidonibacter sp. 1_MG-2023]